MNYDNYKFKAEIDWLDIKIKTQLPTNFQTIRRIAQVPYVEALNAEIGGSATEFKFKFHNPQQWNQIHLVLSQVNEKYKFLEKPTVSSLEVSFDGYSKTNSNEQLIELTEYYLRFLSSPVSQNIRFSGNNTKSGRKVEWIESSQHINKLLNESRNICIGNVEHELYTGKKVLADKENMQIYLKKIDDNKPLDIAFRRARMEIRLQNDILKIDSLEQLENYNFQKLAGYFNTRKLNETLLSKTPISHLRAIQNVSMVGTQGKYGRRIYTPITVANTVLNDKVYDALRDLTNRMKTNKLQ